MLTFPSLQSALASGVLLHQDRFCQMVPGSCVCARPGLLDRNCSSDREGAAFGSGPEWSDVQVLSGSIKSITEVQYRLWLITLSDCKSGPIRPAVTGAAPVSHAVFSALRDNPALLPEELGIPHRSPAQRSALSGASEPHRQHGRRSRLGTPDLWWPVI